MSFCSVSWCTQLLLYVGLSNRAWPNRLYLYQWLLLTAVMILWVIESLHITPNLQWSQLWNWKVAFIWYCCSLISDLPSCNFISHTFMLLFIISSSWLVSLLEVLYQKYQLIACHFHHHLREKLQTAINPIQVREAWSRVQCMTSTIGTDSRAVKNGLQVIANSHSNSKFYDGSD